MKTAILAMFLVLFAPGELFARGDCDKLACAAVKEQIRDIESKMRSGYTRARGERLEAKLRKLKTKRHRLCR